MKVHQLIKLDERRRRKDDDCCPECGRPAEECVCGGHGDAQCAGDGQCCCDTRKINEYTHDEIGDACRFLCEFHDLKCNEASDQWNRDGSFWAVTNAGYGKEIDRYIKDQFFDLHVEDFNMYHQDDCWYGRALVHDDNNDLAFHPDIKVCGGKFQWRLTNPLKDQAIPEVRACYDDRKFMAAMDKVMNEAWEQEKARFAEAMNRPGRIREARGKKDGPVIEEIKKQGKAYIDSAFKTKALQPNALDGIYTALLDLQPGDTQEIVNDRLMDKFYGYAVGENGEEHHPGIYEELDLMEIDADEAKENRETYVQEVKDIIDAAEKEKDEYLSKLQGLDPDKKAQAYLMLCEFASTWKNFKDIRSWSTEKAVQYLNKGYAYLKAINSRVLSIKEYLKAKVLGYSQKVQYEVKSPQEEAHMLSGRMSAIFKMYYPGGGNHEKQAAALFDADSFKALKLKWPVTLVYHPALCSDGESTVIKDYLNYVAFTNGQVYADRKTAIVNLETAEDIAEQAFQVGAQNASKDIQWVLVKPYRQEAFDSLYANTNNLGARRVNTANELDGKALYARSIFYFKKYEDSQEGKDQMATDRECVEKLCQLLGEIADEVTDPQVMADIKFNDRFKKELGDEGEGNVIGHDEVGELPVGVLSDRMRKAFSVFAAMVDEFYPKATYVSILEENESGHVMGVAALTQDAGKVITREGYDDFVAKPYYVYDGGRYTFPVLNVEWTGTRNGDAINVEEVEFCSDDFLDEDAQRLSRQELRMLAKQAAREYDIPAARGQHGHNAMGVALDWQDFDINWNLVFDMLNGHGTHMTTDDGTSRNKTKEANAFVTRVEDAIEERLKKNEEDLDRTWDGDAREARGTELSKGVYAPPVGMEYSDTPAHLTFSDEESDSALDNLNTKDELQDDAAAVPTEEEMVPEDNPGAEENEDGQDNE